MAYCCWAEKEMGDDYLDEEWKWIKGYEALYQISNYGRVKSFHEIENGKILSLNNKNGWYLSFRAVSKESKIRTLRIHVEVAKAFIGDIPKGYHVHHKDGNKQNNRVENLEIIHPSKHWHETEEHNHRIIKGLNDYNRYVKTRKIQQYSLDGILLAEYINGEVASRMTGICQRNILQVANKSPFNKNGSIRKQAGGYIWKFVDEDESEVMQYGYVKNDFDRK